MKGSMRKMLCWGLAELSMGVMLPGEKPAMKVLGGKHIIHVGGKYDSYLLIPVVPEK